MFGVDYRRGSKDCFWQIAAKPDVVVVADWLRKFIMSQSRNHAYRRSYLRSLATRTARVSYLGHDELTASSSHLHQFDSL